MRDDKRAKEKKGREKVKNQATLWRRLCYGQEQRDRKAHAQEGGKKAGVLRQSI